MSEDLRSRMGGALLLVVGAAMAYWGLWRPLQQAQAGAETVKWATRIVILVPTAIVFGLYLLAAGSRYPYRDVERQTLTPVGWALFAVVAVTTLGGYWWMSTMLADMGYVSSYR